MTKRIERRDYIGGDALKKGGANLTRKDCRILGQPMPCALHVWVLKRASEEARQWSAQSLTILTTTIIP
jgi:hypothetical protein